LKVKHIINQSIKQDFFFNFKIIPIVYHVKNLIRLNLLISVI